MLLPSLPLPVHDTPIHKMIMEHSRFICPLVLLPFRSRDIPFSVLHVLPCISTQHEPNTPWSTLPDWPCTLWTPASIVVWSSAGPAAVAGFFEVLNIGYIHVDTLFFIHACIDFGSQLCIRSQAHACVNNTQQARAV